MVSREASVAENWSTTRDKKNGREDERSSRGGARDERNVV